MRKLLHLFLLFVLFFETTVAYAILPDGLIPQSLNSSDPASYLTTKKQLSPCEINFVKLLNGQIPVEVMGAKKTSLWSKGFNVRNYLDEIKGSPGFKTSNDRLTYLESLGKFAHKDEIFVENITDLANLMRNEGLVSANDLRRIFVDKRHPFVTFSFSHNQNKLLSTVNIDPAKEKLIESILESASIGKNTRMEYRQILRGSELSADDLKVAVNSGLRLRKDKASVETFRHYIDFLDGYTVKKISKAKLRSGLENIERIYDAYEPRWYDVDSWFKPHKKFLAHTPENLSREDAIVNVVREAGLSSAMRKEYESVLRRSGLTQEQIEYAHKNGMILRDDQKSFERFKEYMVYLDYLPSYKVKNGLKNIEKIYAFDDETRFFIPASALPTHKAFIAQRNKVLKLESKRYSEIERDFKMQEKDKLMKELDEIMEAKARGDAVDEERILQIKREVDDVGLSPSLLKRARAQAQGEANIFRRLMNGCNGGGSARLASATKKFKNFKIALALGGTPLFYLTKNWDKKDEDPFFWEKLGQEMVMGLFFTLVANKIVTNTNKSFWARYLEGYVKFGSLDVLSAGSYELLFGPQSYIRHFQQIYKGGPVAPNVIEEELEKLKESPTFEQDVKDLMAYLEEMSEKKNFKNLLDKHFNLSTYSSLDENFKITQEDLESEEAREIMLELLAEKMYLNSMGDWPILQTGNSGMDRWLFYRGRNVLFDIKSMALNIAMFEIMCREPLGKVGSWGLVFALVLGDWMYTGDLTYNWRREAINQ